MAIASDRRLRAGALLAAAALLLHELRYVFGYGAGADNALAAHGHAYLTFLTPVVAGFLALAGGVFLVAARDALTGRSSVPLRARLTSTWLAAAAVLVLVFCVQESLEGLVVAGHPGGAAALLGSGGWIALPLAGALGGVVALVLRGSEAVLHAVARKRRRRPRPAAGPLRRPPAARFFVIPAPLARHAAGRAPPAFLS